MYYQLLLLLPAVRCAQLISAADSSFVRPLGRSFPSQGGLGFSWLGGGLHVAHTGRVLRATALAHPHAPFKFATYESTQGNDPWQGVVLIPATAANESFVASAGGAGEVKIVLNVPPDYWAGPGADSAVLLTLETDGVFNPAPPAPGRVLHVLGDSITAATNVRGGFPRCADGGLYADYSSSWAGILCAFFGASCSTVAVGGKGLVKNCCDASTTVPEYYTQLRKNGPDGSYAWASPPQGVLVYLGTNDYSKGGSAALDAQFTAAFLALMRNVSQLYYGTPGAPLNTTFFAILGPMSPTLPAAAMQAAVAQGAARGFNVVLVNATAACGPSLAGCSDGCAGHPGVASHRNIARAVAGAVEAALGWPAPGVL